MAGGVLKNRWIQLGVGIAVSLVCLWWAVAGLLKDDKAVAEIQRAFARADYRTLPLFWLMLATFYVLKAWRWKLLLSPLGEYRTFRDCLPPTMAGFAFNNLLPAHLGDFVRVFLFARQQQAPKTAVLSSAVLERVFDVIAILGFLGLGLALVPGMDGGIRNMAIAVAVFASLFVIAAIIYLFWTEPFVRIVEAVLAKLPFFPAGLRSKLCGIMETGADGLRSLHNPRLVLGIMFSSIAQWALNCLMIHLALWSFGLRESLLVSCIVMGVTAFGVTVPSSPGYFGVIQLCFMTVLKLFTQDEAAVFGASIFYHLGQYIPVTITGLICFNATGLKMGDIQSAKTATQAPIVDLSDRTPEQTAPV